MPTTWRKVNNLAVALWVDENDNEIVDENDINIVFDIYEIWRDVDLATTAYRLSSTLLYFDDNDGYDTSDTYDGTGYTDWS